MFHVKHFSKSYKPYFPSSMWQVFPVKHYTLFSIFLLVVHWCFTWNIMIFIVIFSLYPFPFIWSFLLAFLFGPSFGPSFGSSFGLPLAFLLVFLLTFLFPFYVFCFAPRKCFTWNIHIYRYSPFANGNAYSSETFHTFACCISLSIIL